MISNWKLLPEILDRLTLTALKHLHVSTYISSRITMSSTHSNDVGVLLSSGCRITHGQGANVKQPFPDVPSLTMHELLPGGTTPFSGQLGFINFTTSIRLPRHIHMDSSKQKLIAERILVLNGVGLVELAGEYFVVAPGSLVEAKGGVPHAWTACPQGVKLPDGTMSQGTFTMIYEYEDVTTFFPTASTSIVTERGEYKPFQGEYEEIRIPALSAVQVVERASVVMGKSVEKVELAPVRPFSA